MSVHGGTVAWTRGAFDRGALATTRSRSCRSTRSPTLSHPRARRCRTVATNDGDRPGQRAGGPGARAGCLGRRADGLGPGHVVSVEEQTVCCREQTVCCREQTVCCREQTVCCREQTVCCPEQTVLVEGQTVWVEPRQSWVNGEHPSGRPGWMRRTYLVGAPCVVSSRFFARVVAAARPTLW